MRALDSKLAELGQAQGHRHVLPRLAAEIAKAAEAGDVAPEDALDVYATYFKAASRLKTIDPYDNGVKANVSKLRQIIKAASPELLDRVTKVHDKLASSEDVKPLYQAMVAACRLYNVTGKRLTNEQLANVVRR